MRELAVSFNAMAESLEATERRRLQLVGDVAHELRTPITTLDGYLEGLEDGVIQPGPQTWHVLRTETGRLTRLVSDLSELWRAEAHQLILHPRPSISPRSRGRSRPGSTTRRHPAACPSTVAGPPAAVVGDADRLAQILSNYVSNALHHAPDGSAITITSSVTADHARVSVRDQGPGLAADQLEAVFERFYRVDAARSRAAGGSGIGLAIVRALAEAMHGQAWAESAGPGHGATFHLELPSA